MRLNTKADRLAARAFYIPTGATPIRVKGADAVFYIHDDTKGRPCATCFIGTAGKPSWSYRFLSTDHREKRVRDQAESLIRRAELKAKRKAKDNAPHHLDVGMILVGSWGYEQTNVDFFEIVKVVGKTMVEVEEIGAQTATDAANGFAPMSDHVVPNPESRTGNVTRHKVSRDSIKSPKHGDAYVWDGRPKYCSWYH